ncbi:hypothetical protein CC80DRAFT_487819 [Byssothecium circinans]|uniref:C3H1-type domain-containing protein n=1 Tax=Byssothecium circinans TaxID=147558 RepID=A0A6A5UEE6_9PLEO|nr:hypothetical protein CC80DRAFT_487819 [Byssothecium circinans]
MVTRSEPSSRTDTSSSMPSSPAPPTTDDFNALQTAFKDLKSRLEQEKKNCILVMERNFEYAAKVTAAKEERDTIQAKYDTLHDKYKDSLFKNNALRDRVLELEVGKLECLKELRNLEVEKVKLEGHAVQDSGVVASLKMRVKAYENSFERMNKTVNVSTRKRGAAEDDADVSDPPKKRRKVAVIPCTQCFTKGWECDGKEPCQNCLLQGKQHHCKRVQCKRYSKHTCLNTSCNHAHEEDGFNRIVPFTRLKVHDGGPSPVQKQTSGYANLSEEVGKIKAKGKKGKGDKGYDKGGAAPA